MENRLSLQPPAERDEKLCETESAIEDAMQQWISKARSSNDVRDRVAVANGVSRGVFGSLHLGAGYCVGNSDIPADDFGEFEDFKRAA